MPNVTINFLEVKVNVRGHLAAWRRLRSLITHFLVLTVNRASPTEISACAQDEDGLPHAGQFGISRKLEEHAIVICTCRRMFASLMTSLLARIT